MINVIQGWFQRRIGVNANVVACAWLIVACLLPAAALPAPGGVRLATPRVAPDADRYVEFQRRRGNEMDPGSVLNIHATLVNHEKALAAWDPFARYILRDNALPARDRELVILRIGWLCQAAYEWSHHSVIGARAGLTDAEILRVTEDADAEGWSDFDRALIRAVDELHRDAFISDSTWATLAADYTQQQMIDLVYTVGQYNLVSMILNRFGVQLDEGRTGLPAPSR